MCGVVVTHDELLAKVNELDYVLGTEPSGDKAVYALRAVVELHKPFDFTLGGEPYTGCSCGQDYPCPTIQQIIENLK